MLSVGYAICRGRHPPKLGRNIAVINRDPPVRKAPFPKTEPYMFSGKKIVVVMPAYNAEKTLTRTVAEIDRGIVDEIVLVDDCSKDKTVQIARELNLHVIVHDRNKGYGGNQKSCYAKALALDADVVVMVHPDYQYTPKLIPAMVSMLTSGLFDVVLASRILGGGALTGGMPKHKYVANRILTAIQNIMTGMKLSEFHTGYRCFSRQVLTSLALQCNSDDFLFDNQMLVQSHHAGFKIGEISCPTSYFEDASSINFSRSARYAIGCMFCSFLYLLDRFKLYSAPIFQKGAS